MTLPTKVNFAYKDFVANWSQTTWDSDLDGDTEYSVNLKTDFAIHHCDNTKAILHKLPSIRLYTYSIYFTIAYATIIVSANI